MKPLPILNTAQQISNSAQNSVKRTAIVSYIVIHQT